MNLINLKKKLKVIDCLYYIDRCMGSVVPSIRARILCLTCTSIDPTPTPRPQAKAKAKQTTMYVHARSN